MSATLVHPVPGRRNVHRLAGVVPGLLAAFGLLLLSFPANAGGQRGGGSAPSRGGSGGGHSFSGGSRSSSGGGRSYSAGPRSFSGGGRSYSAGPRSSSGGGRSYSAGPRSSSGGTRSYSTPNRTYASGGRSYSAAPRSYSGGERSSTASQYRGSYGDRPYTSSAPRSTSGQRTISATGTRGGPGGPPSTGGNPGGNPGGHPGGGSGGGHPGDGHGGGHYGGGYYGGGHHGGGYHGWYCPPTYYAGSSWFWGGPWDWWWGWGPSWGWGWGWGGGGVYVVNDEMPIANQYARIDTDVSPETAEVYLDGTLIGQADDFDGFPDYLYLETGKYRLEFRHPSYEMVVKELDVRAGQAISLNDDMKLLPGKKKLEVVDPEDHGTPLGRVFGKPDAKRTASTDDRTGRFDVKAEPGELDDPDGDVLPPSPPPQPAGPDVGDSAPAERSRLHFDVEPDDAAIYLDDRYVGTGEELGGLRRGFPAKPGKHVITVMRPGFQSKTIEVETKPGAAIDVVIELEK